MKPKEQRALESALRKSHFTFYNDVHVGYLTPVEILALVKDGATPHGVSSPRRVEDAKLWVQNGACGPSWFYFEPGKRRPTGKTPSYYNESRPKK